MERVFELGAGGHGERQLGLEAGPVEALLEVLGAVHSGAGPADLDPRDIYGAALGLPAQACGRRHLVGGDGDQPIQVLESGRWVRPTS